MKVKIVLISILAFGLFSCDSSSSEGSISPIHYLFGQTFMLFDIDLPDFVAAPYGKDKKAESSLRKFVKALASGKCKKALEMSIGDAQESVQSTMDAGCNRYKSKIVSAACDVNQTSANCTCTENRGGLDMTYIYEMKFFNGEWVVSHYEKDLDLEEEE
jgi:hypothetical protein